MIDISKLKGLKLIKSTRTEMPKDAVCCVCGTTRKEGRLRRFNEFCMCEKHFMQMIKYKEITDSSKRKHKIPIENLKCCICDMPKMGNINGKPYCRRHYIQMIRKGEIKETIVIGVITSLK